MAVRTKVTCDLIYQNNITFHCVYEPDAAKDTENARFTTATPWGEIKMSINNPEALKQFEIGKEYYVDFNPVEVMPSDDAIAEEKRAYDEAKDRV